MNDAADAFETPAPSAYMAAGAIPSGVANAFPIDAIPKMTRRTTQPTRCESVPRM